MKATRGFQIRWAIPVLIVVCLVSLPAQAKYSGGTGEPNDPYQIATAADLILLGESPGDYGKHFILTADIDLDPNLPGRKVFDKAVIAPDTNDTNGCFDGPVFTGVFDGNGRTISHPTVRGKDFVALFGQLDYGATVKDLRVTDVNIVGLGYSVGGVVGYNCGGTLARCCCTGAVSGSGYDIGGLIGHDYWGSVTECYSGGKVNGESSVGGLIGEMSGYSIGVGSRVAQSYSTAAAGGEMEVGGLVGRNHWGTTSQCYSMGPVSGTDNVGGLIGLNAGNVTQSYSTASVTGNGQHVGGLVGSNDDTASPRVDACFWDTQTSGQATSAGGTGKTTAEMQTAKHVPECRLGLRGRDGQRHGGHLVDQRREGLSETQLARACGHGVRGHPGRYVPDGRP